MCRRSGCCAAENGPAVMQPRLDAVKMMVHDHLELGLSIRFFLRWFDDPKGRSPQILYFLQTSCTGDDLG